LPRRRLRFAENLARLHVSFGVVSNGLVGDLPLQQAAL
jgi:hypothetical protein